MSGVNIPPAIEPGLPSRCIAVGSDVYQPERSYFPHA